MRLTKKRGGVIAAVVMAGGLTAASATSAFGAAPAHSSKTQLGPRHGTHQRLGMHGERTVKGKDGKSVVHEWQTGTVTAVSGDTVTVKSTDGFTLTWTVDATAKAHLGGRGAKGAKGAPRALKAHRPKSATRSSSKG
ncbi:hypothetical protein ACFQ9X_54615 [Catenulispora yoronensis]